ncbi:MAG: helix-turn-helix transcriptional regulator [Clostridiales Family XIII bacterium]|jgi:transcriptional regulator with XRE-family HTH domain|nr:helix-turn-helix transcriptional regulator [Clostridiales Family XIII bacterium]
MILHELMAKKNMSIYRLAKVSQVPYATVNDLAAGRSRMEKCAAGTVYKLARALGVTMEHLLCEYWSEYGSGSAGAADKVDTTDADGGVRTSFETFASNVCHRVKDIGDIAFIVEVLESGDIRRYHERGWHVESFYLLAMVDYLSRINGLPPCVDFEDIRAGRLSEPLYTADVASLSIVLKTDRLKKRAVREALPEFKRFNIMEGNIRDVV